MIVDGRLSAVTLMLCAACGRTPAPSSPGQGANAASGEWAQWSSGARAAGDAELRSDSTLSRRALVERVLASNPTLESARHAWRAARARSDELDALPDPVLAYRFAPGSIFDPDVPYGQTIELSQRFPWPGKIGGRVEEALFTSEMAAATYETARLELALRTCQLYDQYYLIARSLEINLAHQELVKTLRESMKAQYAAGRATFYDPIQAEVVLTHLQHDRHLLETDRRVVTAQLNELLHRDPDAPLPAPPEELPLPDRGPPEARAAYEAAAERSEMRSLEAEKQAMGARLEVEQSEFWPDFTVSGSYSSMWAEPAHQFMVGLSANLPIHWDRRYAAEESARARLAENEADQSAAIDRFRSETYQALARVEEARHVLELYEERLVPLARQQVEAVRPAFATGDARFSEVLAAERGRWMVERDRHAARAALHSRWAELERAMGELPGLGGEDAR